MWGLDKFLSLARDGETLGFRTENSTLSQLTSQLGDWINIKFIRDRKSQAVSCLASILKGLCLRAVGDKLLYTVIIIIMPFLFMIISILRILIYNIIVYRNNTVRFFIDILRRLIAVSIFPIVFNIHCVCQILQTLFLHSLQILTVFFF